MKIQYIDHFIAEIKNELYLREIRANKGCCKAEELEAYRKDAEWIIREFKKLKDKIKNDNCN